MSDVLAETLSARLLQAADNWPDAIAVRHDSHDLSFAELAQKASRLAGWLHAHGVSRGDRVAIALRRNLDMPVAVYGVLMAGAAYVPIDPNAPADRMAAILNDSDVAVMISEEALAPTLEDAAPQSSLRAVLGLTAPLDGLETAPFDAIDAAEPFQTEHGPDDLAYIIFTSGSTGTPKGLTHTHASALAFADMAAALFDLGPDDRMAATSGLHYDMSCMEMFAGLLSGARIVMVPETHGMFPASLSGLLESERVTTLYTVPFLLVRFAEAGALETRDLSSLRLIVHAGEPMPARPLGRLRERFPDARFANFYGPAEVNGVTWWDHPEVPDPNLTDFPIGWPCAQTRLRIEDRDQPAEEGELLIATPAMMRGYWHRPDLDATAFVTRPDEDGIERRYYRSGDHVRRAPDGTLTFLGRMDRQVKLRGHRVELDEIEVALQANPDVSEAAAILGATGQTIRAFAILEAGHHTDPDALRRTATALLPTHAVPTEIQILQTFPRTSSGKINRRELAAVTSERHSGTRHDDARA